MNEMWGRRKGVEMVRPSFFLLTVTPISGLLHTMTKRNFINATQQGATNTQTDTWITPKWIIDAIGPFDLDPCGHLPEGKPIVETAKNYFTEEQNGLNQDWFGDVFVNFPYSDAGLWLTKCAEEYEKGNCNIIVLCFARTETRAWQRNVVKATGINFINKRVKFLNHQGEVKSNGNAPSCLIAFGPRAFDKIKNVDGIVVKVEG
jgi:phage N-6-adenine-methyltransferase